MRSSPVTKSKFLLLSMFSPLALASNQPKTPDITSQCSPAKPNAPVLFDLTVPDDEVVVTSKNAQIIKDKYAEFAGNVTIFQQQQTVKADSAIFNEETNQFTASGNVELTSESATVKGESIFIDENNKDFELQNAEYQFGFNAGHGQAGRFAIDNNNKLSLKDATFTTCPGDDPSWLMASSDIYINQNKGWGEAWNTTFKVGDVPILWVPYITFPITEKRKSGLLFPKFGTSSQYGTYYSQPIYLDLAPNYDFTFTPKYMSERGLLLQGNFRHMTKNSSNALQLEYMNEDKDNKSLGARYLAYWQHESSFQNNWHLTWQVTDLADDNYISEFDSEYHHKADTNLNNFLSLNYYSEGFDFELLSQDIQELGPQTPSYSLPIQLSANWSSSKYLDLFSAKLGSQYSLFEHSEFDINQVQRLHFAPELEFNWQTPAYQLLVSSSYLSTHYKKHNKATGVDDTIDRGLAKHRLLASVTFERNGIYFDNQVRQTLEPKIQYLYTQNVDQSGIGLYDSQLLKEDYFSLFRENTYSGIDRIVAMNQAAVGISSSIFNSQNKEMFRFGVAQILKFENFDGTNDKIDNSKAPIALEWFGQLSENWQLDGGVLYNRENETLDSGFLSLDYWLAKDKNLQINHRYADNIAGSKINQSGFFASYQINPKWAVAASYHYDLETKNDMDALLGLEYRTCCWSIQVAAKRQVVVDLNDVNYDQTSAIQYNNGISVNFKISGMGGNISSSIADLFKDSIFAYRRPYLITK